MSHHPSTIAEQMLSRMTSEDTALKDQNGKTVMHLWWMLEQITMMQDNNKAHRWLGYAQALMVTKSIATLDELRELNRTGKWK